MAKAALSGLKVLEYAEFINGPFCARILGDLGAEVIKIEPPAGGDIARRREPFAGDDPHPEKSGLFLYLNFNKKGITLDPRTPVGKQLFLELARDADVLIENQGAGAMSRLGLGYTALKKLNPRMIMASITSFGQTGPYKNYQANNLVSMHMSGLAYAFTGIVPDPEEQPPLNPGGHQGDFVTGITAAINVMSAIYHRLSTGKGDYLDISELEACAYNEMRDYGAYIFEKAKISRTRAALARTTGLIQCMDGWVQFHGTEERHWRAVLEAMGNPEWGKDERFKDDRSRADNWQALRENIMTWTMKHSKQEIFHMMQARHIAFAPANTPEEVVKSPHLAAREYFVEFSHPVAGKVKYPGAPFKLSRTPWKARYPAPPQGQHNGEIF
ncbi:MAG: CoA transferase [Chloroflexi bacterium]|nr:CoA transferase [Chloroflexota bacterium]